MSSQKLYTISDDTLEFLDELNQDVTIYHMVQSGQEDDILQKMLTRYEEASKHIKVDAKDPVLYPNFASQYTDTPLADNSLIIVNGNKSKVVDYNSLYEVDYDYYTGSSSTTGFDGEGQIDSAIAYVTSDNIPVIYALEGHSEMKVNSDLKNSMEKANYQIESLNLLTTDGVPEDAGCLLIASPQNDLSEDEARKIISYLENGGKTMIFTDYINLEMPNLKSVLEIYGAINLYTYRLSRNQQILQWQHDFTNNRYIAEMLRILIHFLPYGVSLNIGKLCGENNRLYTYIKHLIDDAEPEEQNINQKNLHDMLQHTKELLDDQITYHQSSEQRYEKIVSSLDKWGKRIMYIGLAVVIGRGVLQFALVLLKTIQEVNNTELINPTIISIARSFLNMLALLLPAWAGYFTTKVQQNNFRYNLNNHQQMISRLNMIREKVVRVMKLDDIPMEVVNTMILELEETMMLQDSLEWYHQYMNSSVKPL